MSVEKLLDCPFCGGVAERMRNIAGFEKIRCTECYASTNWQVTKTFAAKDWNRRKPKLEQAREALQKQEALKACIEKLSDSRYECFVADRNGVIELLKQFSIEGSAENDRE